MQKSVCVYDREPSGFVYTADVHAPLWQHVMFLINELNKKRKYENRLGCDSNRQMKIFPSYANTHHNIHPTVVWTSGYVR